MNNRLWRQLWVLLKWGSEGKLFGAYLKLRSQRVQSHEHVHDSLGDLHPQLLVLVSRIGMGSFVMLVPPWINRWYVGSSRFPPLKKRKFKSIRGITSGYCLSPK
jgi:hypothetical protein